VLSRVSTSLISRGVEGDREYPCEDIASVSCPPSCPRQDSIADTYRPLTFNMSVDLLPPIDLTAGTPAYGFVCETLRLLARPPKIRPAALQQRLLPQCMCVARGYRIQDNRLPGLPPACAFLPARHRAGEDWRTLRTPPTQSWWRRGARGTHRRSPICIASLVPSPAREKTPESYASLRALFDRSCRGKRTRHNQTGCAGYHGFQGTSSPLIALCRHPRLPCAGLPQYLPKLQAGLPGGRPERRPHRPQPLQPFCTQRGMRGRIANPYLLCHGQDRRSYMLR